MRKRYLVPGATILLSCMFVLSCAGVKPYADLEIITDERVIEAIRNRWERIKTIQATLGLTPAAVTAPELDAYISYNKKGLFRLTGLTPTGFTLFDFETEGNQFNLLLSNGRRISGNMDEYITGFQGISGVELSADPGIVREAIDFYGSEVQPDAAFFIEGFKDYYILNQVRREGEMSYPIRRWWIDKRDMTVVRKEIFSRHPDRMGERLFEVLYGDFRMVEDIRTPFEILVKGREGKKLLKMRFYKVEYNKN